MYRMVNGRGGGRREPLAPWLLHLFFGVADLQTHHGLIWAFCAFSLGHPHRSRQLCDQPFVWFSSFAHRGGAGWWLHPRVWQEDGSEWMVTTQLQWDPGISSAFPSHFSSLLVSQPCHDLPRAHSLGGEGIPAETSWRQHNECQVKELLLFELFSLKHSLLFSLKSTSGISEGKSVKLFRLTFTSVINSCSNVVERRQKKKKWSFPWKPVG